ncbi:ubiquinone anaerobic biosynthesis accessory factor UbiT [Aliidiomarina indica]|uniref:ubiquinone anaerobic biosynthesis accessory factor UbiT n=1 Tax=Aliidiomarina indica TaxID=2749147 RepID=UPI00188EA6BF|nr:SCP2 sterol-binding domain-containing protein [Aliidiomarina indica]
MFDIKRVTHKVIPKLPGWTKTGLKYSPKWPMEQLSQQLLKHVFSDQLEAGELDFLTNTAVVIGFEDIGLFMQVTLQKASFMPLQVKLSCEPTGFAKCDVQLSGNTEDFFLMIAQRVDPDTLFFRRKLRIHGDTELGLGVKNLLDTVDMPAQLPSRLLALFNQVAESIEAYQTYASAKSSP